MAEDAGDPYDAARARMVAEQLAGRDIKDPAVLRAMRLVPRERFIPRAARPYAYDDGPLPIPANQTISQPYVVATMIAALALRPGDRVLEIGAGSGYAAAVLSRIVAKVYTCLLYTSLRALSVTNSCMPSSLPIPETACFQDLANGSESDVSPFWATSSRSTTVDCPSFRINSVLELTWSLS